ncbi:MAG: adenylate/guanylate cyclase domain-containing protein [Acidobacteriota bacterium]
MAKASEWLRRSKLGRGFLMGIGAFSLALVIHGSKAARPLEWKSWDLRVRLLADSSRASREIVIFLIDQYSLDIYAQQQGLAWPWPRQIYSAVVDYLRAGGAKAVFFDLLFSESSRSGVEDDQDLSRALARAGHVFLPLSLSQKGDSALDTPPELLSRFALSPEELPRRDYPSAITATLPIPELLQAARGAGTVLFNPDGDGIFRRLPLAVSYGNLLIPSVPLALSRFVRQGEKLPAFPFDKEGNLIIRYHGPTGTYPTYKIAAIVNSWAQLEAGAEPQLPPQEFAGKIVFVGGSAPGLLDLRSTPLDAVSPGVNIQAAVTDNILSQDFMRSQPPALFLGLLLFFAVLTAMAASVIRKIGSQVAVFFVCLALPLGASGLAFRTGYWLELVIPELAVLTSFIAASLLNYSLEGKERRFIKSVFRYYLSPDVIERIIQNPSLLRLGGEKREISSFFSDVAGFTTLSEALSPEDLVSLLNEYLSEMTDIILSAGGTLDKYEGDAIIAFWNAPLEQADHALRACRAALLCQKRLAELRPHFQEKYGHTVAMRIGLNSGPAVVGNMGSSRRFDYTAIGDAVNLAARLEGACKQYKIPLLAGEEAYRRVKNEIAAREVDIIRVVGKKAAVAVYEIIGERSGLAVEESDRLRRYEKAREAYKRREWEGAALLFAELGEDAVARLYLDRCQRLKQSPPAEDWDGVYDLKFK